jgi:hypothetical protein
MLAFVRPALLASLLVALATPALAGCGGAYVDARAARADGPRDRGETDGRMFDFVSNKPDGDQWTIRIRGASMYVAYALARKADDLGSVTLSDKEAKRVWKLIDAVGVKRRKRGKEDHEAGYVQLQLRIPGDANAAHAIYKAYVSRDTEDDDVIALAAYLQDLVARYHHQTPNF